jgi:hypothetical protein
MCFILDRLTWDDDPKDPDRHITKLGKLIITVPRDYVMPHPMFCPVCLRPMRDTADHLSFDVHGCCDFCDTHFARPNRVKWAEGWRPSHDEVTVLLNEKCLGVVIENSPEEKHLLAHR